MTQQDAARAGEQALIDEIRREPLQDRLVRLEALLARLAAENRAADATALTPENEALFIRVTIADARAARLK